MSGTAQVIPYSAFLEYYRPSSEGIVEGSRERAMFETFGSDLQTVLQTDPQRVWTVIDVDLSDGAPHPYGDEDGDNCWVIVAGYHRVNRIGYLITEIPWQDDFIEVVY